MSDHGRHVWFDLMTPDPKAGSAFYRQLVGYGTQSWDEGDYEMFTVEGGKTIGGVMKLSEEAVAMGAPPHWVGYVAVADVDATTAKVAALGGKVLRPKTEIPGAGAFAIAADPQGAVFAVYHSSDESSPKADKPKVGEVSWVELMASDHDAALTFYSELFGWRRTEAMDMGGSTYQMFGLDNTMGGAFDKKSDMPGPPAWLYYLYVADVNDTIARATELGATLVNGPNEVPGGDLVAQLCDPQGAMFAIHGGAAAQG